ncbi:hypothetical protein CBP51_10815 [Cellvibrio mixtus]|uniref:Uncharacterized protein n=1 Tax=Cellvibrio mixtus TaxID=39650 RepID=A0A266QDJ6_9GAMM|nr:DUF6519 domain-containing protein [Cellvibrio mixtus]OZY87439.1 hypothetical protein CBP51_10815 [Cellvibrio mixtus]
MKTQISRASFNAANNYSGVYQQMGRMVTDADWNELTELIKFQMMDTLQDVIGSGTPRARGMVKEIAPNNVQLHWGHVYVDGIRARVVPHEKLVSPQFIFSKQQDFPAAPSLSAGEYRFYVDVWERSVSALENTHLLDPGLHGADTCTRTQTMAQIKACATSISVADIYNPARNPALGTVQLSLTLRAGTELKDPCDPCADELALQDEVGNYLFRVEVHQVHWSSDAEPHISGITFKWSSENGAEQYVDGETPPGFESSQWCYEFFSGPNDNPALNMTSEKHLGHHLMAGFTPQCGELVKGYPASKPANLPLVRRWDGFVKLQKNAGGWTLVDGADRGRDLSNSYNATDHAFVDLSGPVQINLQETVLTLTLDDKRALAGDYWQAPVRQAIHSAGSTLLDQALPSGIVHHYLVLGRAHIAADGSISQFIPEADECKTFEFPPLTDISAGDVCYDNSDCDGPNVRTVQEALDYLCRQRNLKWHNKHLHGMGVLCGLKVICAPTTVDEDGSSHRHRVTVTPGYALGCEGDDLVLDLPEHVDVISAIQQLEQEHNIQLIDGEGNAAVCLYIDIGEGGGAPQLKIAPHDAKDHQESIFDGTIWMDFYHTCIKQLLDDIKEELDDLNIEEINESETEKGELVSIRRKKLFTLLNLFALFTSQPHGAYVFTSHKEHIILRDFYNRLRDILQSKTFCGLLADSEFPEYPFPETGMNTFFGRDHHQRLQLHPNEKILVTYEGTDTSINIFDIEQQIIIARSEVPSAQGGVTTAVTFSQQGDLIYAAVDINGMDSILTRGRFDKEKIDWEVSAVLCSVRVADMRFNPKQDNQLMVLGVGDGIYLLDVDKLFSDEKIVPAPSLAFNAVGHVAYDFDAGFAFATANTGKQEITTDYNAVAIIELAKLVPIVTGSAPVAERYIQLPAQGSDGLAVRNIDAQGNNALYVVVTNNGQKTLYQYHVNKGIPPTASPLLVNHLPDTEITLAYHHKRDELLVALADHFCVQVYQHAKLIVPRVPLQLMPTALAISPESGQLYALNYASNTISLVPVDELEVTDEFNQQLAQYRWAVITAFVALLGNLLQSLKDCFCQLLLMNCPDCDENDKVWLATITVKNGEVYKVCNIGKRKDVWTFPKFEYWLSLIPILPVIKLGVAKLCCMVLPNLLSGATAKFQSEQHDYALVKSSTYKQSVQQAKRTDVKKMWRENTKSFATSSSLVRDTLLYPQRKPTTDGVGKEEYRNVETAVAVQRFEQKGMQVEVKEYQGDQAALVLQHYQQTPKVIAPDSKVTVYQKNGRVLFYAAETKPQAVLVLDENKLTQMEVRKQALENMQALDESLARAEARKNSVTETAGIQLQLKQLQDEKIKAEEDLATLSSQLNILRTERSKAQQELLSMQEGMVEISSNLKTLQLEVTKVRPVKELTSLDDNTREILQREGVLTVNDMATVDSSRLIASGVDAQKLSVMVQEAQNKLKLLR